jgi:hypothetical protein
MDAQKLECSCQLIADYTARFRNRLSPRNLVHIRQLLTLTTALLKLLRSLTSSSDAQIEQVFTMSHFLVRLDCSEIDFFKLIEYLEASKLCRKLRDFRIRFAREEPPLVNEVGKLFVLLLMPAPDSSRARVFLPF